MPAGNSIVCQQGWICVEGACCRLGLEKHGVPQELWRVRMSPHPHPCQQKSPPTVPTDQPLLAMLATHLGKAVTGPMVCRRKKTGIFGLTLKSSVILLTPTL